MPFLVGVSIGLRCFIPCLVSIVLRLLLSLHCRPLICCHLVSICPCLFLLLVFPRHKLRGWPIGRAPCKALARSKSPWRGSAGSPDLGGVCETLGGVCQAFRFSIRTNPRGVGGASQTSAGSAGPPSAGLGALCGVCGVRFGGLTQSRQPSQFIPEQLKAQPKKTLSRLGKMTIFDESTQTSQRTAAHGH